LSVGGIERSYLVHLPPTYDASRPSSVVLAFHGGGTNAETMVSFSGLNEKADEAGFIAVYPNGSGRVARALTFNGGNCCGYAMRHNVDDVGFVRALLDDLAGLANLDAARVFATGMSNGAMICYRLAAELSERIAAIAPVAGPMGAPTCDPKRPVSVMHFHGTADEFAPFEGGVGRRSLSRTDFYSVDHTMHAWVKANGCPTTPRVSRESPVTADGLTIERRIWSPGEDGSEVVLFVIGGGGHTWPGRDSTFEMLGKSTRQISANDLMWEFFQRHPMIAT
jgi:polyhydroxybutyrate depolymerase